jgi:hypothetical protein
MSRVTNVIVTLDILDHKFIIDRLNTWLRLGDHSTLLKVDEYCGGKAFEAHVYMGAFNYFNSYRFLEFCKLIKQKHKHHHIHFSLLIVDPENSHYFLEIGEPL